MINSAKRSFEEYKLHTQKSDLLKDKSLSNLYAQYIDADIIPGSVFVMNYERYGDHTFLESILRQFSDRTVYCSYVHREKFSDCPHAVFAKKNSEEYFKAMATSQYLILDSAISSYFVPKEGQCVIAVLDAMEPVRFSDITDWTKTLMKADIVTATQGDAKEKLLSVLHSDTIFSGTYMNPEQIAGVISSGKTDFLCQTPEPNKHKIAITALFEHTEKWFPVIYNYLAQIDFTQNDITLIVDNKHLKALEQYLQKLDSRVKITTRAGWFLISEENRKMYDYCNSELLFLDDPDAVFSYVPKEVYQREFRRCVGHQTFDTLLLVGDRLYNRNYWFNIGRALDIADRQIIYDPAIYDTTELTVTTTEIENALAKNAPLLYLQFDRIWFWGQHQRDTFLETCDKYGYTYQDSQTGILDFAPTQNLSLDTHPLAFNNEIYIAYNNYYTDTLQIDMIKQPDASRTNYAVIIDSDDDFDADKVNRIRLFARSHKDADIYVLDLKDIAGGFFATMPTEVPNINYYAGAMYYYLLQAYMDTFVIHPDNAARRAEIAPLNKTMIDDME